MVLETIKRQTNIRINEKDDQKIIGRWEREYRKNPARFIAETMDMCTENEDGEIVPPTSYFDSLRYAFVVAMEQKQAECIRDIIKSLPRD